MTAIAVPCPIHVSRTMQPAGTPKRRYLRCPVPGCPRVALTPAEQDWLAWYWDLPLIASDGDE